MAKRLLVVVAVLLFGGVVILGQAKPSIQGVWRAVESTITSPTPSAAGLPTGTHTNIQPGLVMFTAKHYGSMTDIAGKPRPTTGFKVSGKPTLEEVLAVWGPFNGNMGTYELTGTTLTLRPIVAKNPALQGSGFIRFTTKLDGSNLWLTLVEVSGTGKLLNPSTIKYARVE